MKDSIKVYLLVLLSVVMIFLLGYIAIKISSPKLALACDCQIIPSGTEDTEPLTSNESHSRSGSIPVTPVKKPIRVWDVVHFGDKGEDVKTLQILLNNWGAKLKVDGKYGKLTLKAFNDIIK